MLRRHFLSSALAVSAATAFSEPAQAQSARAKSTVLFIHGAWHGAWCWSPVIERLTSLGVRCLAIDMPGHGVGAAFPEGYFSVPQDLGSLAVAPSPLASLTVESYREHAAAAIRGLLAAGGPVTLVGHSLGGVTLNAIGEMDPSLVRRLVYLTALNPVAKPAVGPYFGDPSFATSKALPLFLGDPEKTGAVRLNVRSSDPAFQVAAKAAFYGHATDAQFAAVANLLTPDEPAALFGGPVPVTAQRWGRIPRAYIRCVFDDALPIAAQDQFIAEADALTPNNRYLVHTMNSDHSPFITQPAVLAKLIYDLA